MRKLYFLLAALLVITAVSGQNTFQSVQDGNWNDASTWTLGAGLGGTEGVDYPSASDIVIIDNYVIIDATNNGTNFSFTGTLTINADDTLESQVGDNVAGFVLEGNGLMTNNGSFFTLDPTEEPDENAKIPYEFVCKDNSVFIGGINSFAFISDDWNIQDNAQIFIDNLNCYAVSDDVIFNGTSCMMYGEGNIRIGGDGANSNVEFNSGATTAQLDDDVTIWRNVAAVTCGLPGVSVTTGTNTDGPPPFAFDDSFTTSLNTAQNQTVLTEGSNDDFSPISGDQVTITSAGSNVGGTNGSTTQGGTVLVNNNGTAGDPADDFIVYTPPVGFIGTDTYNYLITNNAGETDIATVTVLINSCGSGFITDTTIVTATAQSNNSGVGSPANVLGAPDASFAEWHTGGDILNIDFGQIFSSGTQYRITWRVRSTETPNAQPVIRESTTNGSFTNVATAYLITSTTAIETIVTSENDFRFLQITKDNGVDGTDFEIDAIEVLDINCLPDRDNDGISDEDDIDADNDGIPDIEEQLCISYTMDWNDYFVSGVNPTTTAPTQPLVFDNVTLSFALFNATNVDDTDVGIQNNREGWFFLKDRDPINDTTVAVIRFSTPVFNYKTTIVDVDFDAGEFRDNVIFDAYLTDGTIYTVTAADFIVGTANEQVAGNHFRGIASTTGRAGDISFSIPQLIDSVRVSYYHDENPFNTGQYAIVISDMSWEICSRDTDGDGIEDYLDLDSDNDGIPDIIEAGGVDADNDGIADNLTDTDGDGLADIYDSNNGGTAIPNEDFDGDGIPNALDLDSDNDGIPDVIEAGGTDADNNGVADDLTDGDSDGWSNLFDSDNGGTVHPLTDSDGTGNPNYLDLDSDDDGVSDIVEAGGIDTDGDGVVDSYLDSDRDGWADTFDSDDSGTALTYPDSDGDGLRDEIDLDSDNDGIPDVVEAGGVDTDGNGLLDITTDLDNDGIADAVETDISIRLGELGDCSGQEDNYDHEITFESGTTDATGDVSLTFCLKGDYGATTEDIELTDENGTVTVFDRSNSFDNSTYGDCEELEFCITTTITLANWNAWNNDGQVNFTFTPDANVNFCASYSCLGQVTVSYPIGTNGTALVNADSDGDGQDDRIDLDADNDGIPDVVEAGGTDENGDGRADDYADSDNDGFNDVVDGDVGQDGTSENTSNALTVTGSDGDNNGVPDTYPNDDNDGDGIPNSIDLDADNDGIPDVVEAGGTDVNGDGRADEFVDLDNDGFNDRVDGDPTNALAVGSDANGANTSNALTLTGNDGDNDGAPDSIENDDVDGDNVYNFLDLDSDNDGIADVVEAGGTDVNGDGRADNYTDTDGDGFNDSVDGDPTNALTVGSDANGANTTDALTITGPDNDNDGAPDSIVSDDFDGDNVYNFFDLDSDDDGILDVTEAGGTDTDRDGIEDSFADADSDGFNDNVDGDPDNSLAAGNDATDSNLAGVTVATGEDTDGDGAPNSFPNDDFDGDGLYNFIDIDADNDGIVDNTEGQSTAGYIAPANSDDDGDGIDNAYDADDANFGGAGSSFVLSDIDSATDADSPDYLDLDSDNDGKSDAIEGHDTDNDDLGDGSSPANTGLPAGTTDADGDGLLDGYDNNTASSDPTNTNLQGTSHPNIDETMTTERDWREIEDFDRDGVADIIDIDDDNDGILDVDEGCTPQNNYPTGFVVAAGVSGAGSTVNDPDGTYATFLSDNSQLTFDYGAIFETGTEIFIHWREAASQTGTATFRLEYSEDNATFISDGRLQETNNLVAVDDTLLSQRRFRYLRITQVGSTDIQLDALGVNVPDVCIDTDGDGQPDNVDLDSDNDGIADIIEAGGVDTDGNGFVDGAFVDADGDGFSNVFDTDETGVPLADEDFDVDGLPNRTDIDADNDGIVDVIEGQASTATPILPSGVDSDNDGIDDAFDPDSGNSLLDPENTDGTDTPDYIDLDSDNDKLVDISEAYDTDNDGVIDLVPLGTDADGDGLDDAYDAITPINSSTNVTNGGQTSSSFPNDDEASTPERDWREASDSDNDGIADVNDLDNDNDGIPDSQENCTTVNTFAPGFISAAGVSGAGLISGAPNNAYATFTTSTANLVIDFGSVNDLGSSITLTWRERAAQTGTGIVRLEYSLDNVTYFTGSGRFVTDNTSGVTETLLNEYSFRYLRIRNTTDADVEIDAVELTSAANCEDSDGDGIPDYLDLDSDNDGIPDIVEAGGEDTDGNGLVDDINANGTLTTDTDNDGLADLYDSDNGGTNIANPDSDGDGIANPYDVDSDNDGIPDVIEVGGTDVNGDGRADDYVDTDNDGFNDVLDGDVGQDGTSENTANALVLTGADTDDDGVPNSYPGNDTDGDGILDHLDLDSDNDGIPDVVEVGGTDANGDGRADDYSDADGDGFNDVVDGDPTNALAVGSDANGANTSDALIVTGTDSDNDGEPNSYPTDDNDGDGVLNQLDLDADNDGIADVVEAGGTDVNGDGRADDYTDGDNDGFNDVVDGDPTNALAVGSDVNGANTADALTLTGLDTDNDGNPNSFPNDDLDGDNVYNFLDLDSDDDGILDVTEAGGTDTDRDGIEDSFTDADTDGFNDNVDGDPDNSLAVGSDATDSNLAGVTVATGDDTDGDGAPNLFPNDDFDGDNLYNFIDIDADNDGIVDNTEGQSTAGYVAPANADDDGDGIDNAYDADDANFGGAGSSFVLSDIDSATDIDSPDYLDGDSDDDGKLDLLEGHDSDGDGVADASSPSNTGVSGGNTDSDGDGLLDGFDNNTSSTDPTNTGLEGSDHPNLENPISAERDWRELADRDNDGIADKDDIDDDNDGILDVDESTCRVQEFDFDIDAEGWYKINENDNAQPGSIPSSHSTDAVTANIGCDIDATGAANANIAGSSPTFTDYLVDVDGRNNIEFMRSPDLGGIDISGLLNGTLTYDAYNYRVGFTGDPGWITSGGNAARADVYLYNTSGSFVRANRLITAAELIEWQDGNWNTFTFDIDDATFSGTLADLVNVLTDFQYISIRVEHIGGGNTANCADIEYFALDNVILTGDLACLTLNDIDGDGIPNSLDLDSDNDGIPDIIEAGGVDTDDDGRVDGFVDTDGDGWANTFDPDDTGTPLADGDQDGDGFENRIDLDADDDGLPDIVEAGGTDTNNDGMVDSPSDTDADGWDDTFDGNNGGTALAVTDTDGDGTLPNYLDIDSDNDGIIDNIEWQTTINHDVPSGTDANNNGWDDEYDNGNPTPETISNNDGAGDGADYIDLNSDTDAQPDWQEGFDDDEDGDALNDLIARANAYETAAGNPNDYVASDDADSDGIPDFLEDADSDGTPNFLDPDNATFYQDTDNDGLVDLFDADNNGSASNTPGVLSNGDADGEPDFRDSDNDVTLPIQLVHFTATKVGERVQLDWQTQTEINNDYFTIERSIDGVEFEEILQQEGAGNSSRKLDYRRFDESPQAGYNYYRLKQTDYDGRSESFNIEVVYFGGISTIGAEVGNAMKLYPNPSEGREIYLAIDKIAAGRCSIEILNQFGQLISQQELNLEEAQVNYKLELLRGIKLASGTYHVRVLSETETEVIPFIIKK